MEDRVSSWVMGILVGVLGLVGLVLAAGAHEAPIHAFGLGVFAFAILFIFFLVKRAFDAGGEEA